MSDFEPLKVPANTEVTYTVGAGEQRTLRSKALEGDDDYHYIEPKNAGDVEALRGFGYPVARKVLGEADDADAPAAEVGETTGPGARRAGRK